jgi:hypothetical protein
MALRTFEPCTAPTSVPDPIPNPTRVLHIDPRPSHATAPHRPQPDLNLAPQSSPLEAAVKSEPAFDAESCGAKSTVPPKRGFVKAVPYCTIADQHTVKRQTHCTMYTRAVVHMQGSCACSAEVLPTC